MKPVQEISLKLNVKDLAKEMPLDVVVYEKGLDDVLTQLFKTFGVIDVCRCVNETTEWLRENNKKVGDL
jgi:hypothetical protein